MQNNKMLVCMSVIGILLLLGIWGCNFKSVTLKEVNKDNPSSNIASGVHESENDDIDALLSAPEKIKINKKEIYLNIRLWRDFQPISPEGGKPLIALIRIKTTDGKALPTSLTADRLWVIHHDQDVWDTEFSDEERPENSSEVLEKIARNGPKWAPDTMADVIVRIGDGEKTYLIRSSNQRILQTH